MGMNGIRNEYTRPSIIPDPARRRAEDKSGRGYYGWEGGEVGRVVAAGWVVAVSSTAGTSRTRAGSSQLRRSCVSVVPAAVTSSVSVLAPVMSTTIGGEMV